MNAYPSIPFLTKRFLVIGSLALLGLHAAAQDLPAGSLSRQGTTSKKNKAENGSTFGADSAAFYQTARTVVNPVLGGDHPDPTMLKVGDDFYMCGSCFHFTPYLPILHSRDLVHWQEVSRVVAPDWGELKNGTPGAGIWQGAVTYFYGSYWIYFSNGSGGGQYFSRASSPAGPWSAPVKVKTNASTGPIGYDNSVFVDDDGTAYMLTKAGKPVNRIQKIGTDGHLTGEAINLDWINANGRYSWAEGPVMCKRDGWYYYTFARDVSGGQFVYRSQSLTSDSTKWEALGNFFAPITDAATGFRVSNHMSAPIQLKDGSWWAIAQSYEKAGDNDWSGQGRQSLLHRIDWDAKGRPFGVPPTSAPFEKPRLTNSGYSWALPRTDDFDNSNLKLSWHFLNKQAAASYSLTARPGWMRLDGSNGKSHILQKEAGHYYTMVTRVEVNATAAGQQGGLYLTNGNESVTVRLGSGYAEGKKIIFSMGDVSYTAENKVGNTLWLKLDRKEHDLYGYYSADGLNWTQVGSAIRAVSLDKAQPNFNSWVGTSIGLFAEGARADFDRYVYKDGFSELPVAGYNNYFGVQTLHKEGGKVVTNTSVHGGWLMLGGVDLGKEGQGARRIEVSASALAGGNLEVWMDDLGAGGRLLATVPVKATGSAEVFKTFSAAVSGVSGQHDIYLKFPAVQNAFYLNTIRFVSNPLRKGDGKGNR